MKIAAFAAAHARSILFLLLALVIGGVVSSYALPVSLFPHVTFPRIRVNLEAGERPAQRMMVEVTSPVEQALRSIAGVRTVSSITSRGSAEVDLTFDWGVDMTSAFLQSQAEVNRLLPTLPDGATFEIRRMDPTVFPVIAYSLTSDRRPLSELHDLAQYQLLPLLSTVNGVAKIGVDGGAVDEYRVILDPTRLAARGLAISDVTSALAAANVLSAVGKIEDFNKLYLVVADAQFDAFERIGQTVLRGGAGGIVRLADVAEIRQATAPSFVRSTADGRDAVLINVYQQPGGNTVRIDADVHAALDAETAHLPADVKLHCWYDQSDLITASAVSVRDAVIIGVVLAALVLLLFLRDLRITLVAALAVPIVLAVTCLLLYLLGQSLNIMTLGGMAAAVGLIIDDAIVMSEHIVRRLHGDPEHGVPSRDAPADSRSRIRRATDEFTKPLIGSSLSTIVIHIPPAFLVGVFGAFFAALSLSMAISLVISFLVAWLAIPILAGALLTQRDVKKEQRGPVERRVDQTYAALMRFILPRPWTILLLIVPLLIWGYFDFTQVQTGVMPAMDEGGFVIDYVGPPSASLTEMDRLLGRVERILRSTAEVETYSRRTGFSLGGDISESNVGDFFVRLKPTPRRAIDEVMKEVRQRINRDAPGLDIDPKQLMEDLIGDLTGQPQPVVVNLFSDDEATLLDLAPKVADALRQIDYVNSVEDGVVPAGDALDIHIDRAAAALEGVDPDAVSRQLQDLISGNVTTQIQQGAKLIDVRTWIPRDLRRNTDQLAALPIRAPDGHLIPLSRIARFEFIPGQPEITRQDLKRVVSVTARSDRDLGTTIHEVQRRLAAPGLIPENVRFTLGGLYEQQQAAFHGVVRVIAAAATLVLLLLLFLYERFRVAAAIMFISVLTIAAVFIGLSWTGTELNISSMMGMVMIVGNVTEVAIFYYSEFAGFTRVGSRIDRLISAGAYRLRAILMTTLAAILALLPLALNLGQGAAMLQPLAIAIVTGLIVQLPFVLILFPALLQIFAAVD